jgi:hypothetical protein
MSRLLSSTPRSCAGTRGGSDEKLTGCPARSSFFETINTRISASRRKHVNRIAPISNLVPVVPGMRYCCLERPGNGPGFEAVPSHVVSGSRKGSLSGSRGI